MSKRFPASFQGLVMFSRRFVHDIWDVSVSQIVDETVEVVKSVAVVIRLICFFWLFYFPWQDCATLVLFWRQRFGNGIVLLLSTSPNTQVEKASRHVSCVGKVFKNKLLMTFGMLFCLGAMKKPLAMLSTYPTGETFNVRHLYVQTSVIRTL